jgi:hypothetical protein
MVGQFVASGGRPLLDAAWEQQRIVREGDPEWRDDVPVRVEAIPVRRGDRLLGVVGRSTNLMGIRTPSRLELSYLQTAAELTKMISDGAFPYLGERSELEDAMRVGDGFVRTAASGTVTYASPNAQSAFRRLGLSKDLLGLHLAHTVHDLVPASASPVAEALAAVLSGRSPRATEVDNGQASLVVRAMPLRSAGVWNGSLLLLRDVTELRLRERELVSKEATIREIHHRVKNNLQTVAALLRLQARRVDAPEARQALQEATRRVGSIAVVHETLSQSLDETVQADEVVDRLRAMVVDVSAGDSTGDDGARRQLRRPPRRGGHAAGDGAHRAHAERRRTRLRASRRACASAGHADAARSGGRGGGRWRGTSPRTSTRCSPTAWDRHRPRARRIGAGRCADVQQPARWRDHGAARCAAAVSSGGADARRAVRRFSARRSSSLRPPHTP